MRVVSARSASSPTFVAPSEDRPWTVSTLFHNRYVVTEERMLKVPSPSCVDPAEARDLPAVLQAARINDLVAPLGRVAIVGCGGRH
jgi:hypothetical protein